VNKMLKHIVMMKLDPALSEGKRLNQASFLKEELEKLPARIPQIKYFEVGLNICDKPQAFDLVLLSRFEDVAALDQYRAHSEHQAFYEILKKYLYKVAVTDYWEES